MIRASFVAALLSLSLTARAGEPWNGMTCAVCLTCDDAPDAHRQLLRFPAEKRNEIWVAPLLDIAEYMKKQ